MPGVDSNNATKDENSENDTARNSPEEITQTDKLNKRLLMSYLQRINETQHHNEQELNPTLSTESWNRNEFDEDS